MRAAWRAKFGEVPGTFVEDQESEATSKKVPAVLPPLMPVRTNVAVQSGLLAGELKGKTASRRWAGSPGSPSPSSSGECRLDVTDFSHAASKRISTLSKNVRLMVKARAGGGALVRCVADKNATLVSSHQTAPVVHRFQTRII